MEDKTCVFCSENESVHHLFFDCVVAQEIWKDVADSFDFNYPQSMLQLSVLWGANNKKKLLSTLLVLLPFGAFGSGSGSGNLGRRLYKNLVKTMSKKFC